MPVISVQNSWIVKSKCLKYLAFSMQESNHKAPLFRKKTAPWIVQIKYTISWNKEQQSVARFFPSRFFWSLFFPHEITLALFFPSGNSKQLRWIEFPSGKNKASVISFGKKRLLKKSFVKKSCKLCCCLFPSILYFIRTILGGAVFLPVKGALILHSKLKERSPY